MTDRINAAAYIADLEAKLAKKDMLMQAGFAEYERRLALAVWALEAGVAFTSEHGGAAKFLKIARTTLAQLKGEAE